MTERPNTEWVPCPHCDDYAVAVIPPDSRIVRDEERADGKVRVDCRECGERFPGHYRFDPDRRDSKT